MASRSSTPTEPSLGFIGDLQEGWSELRKQTSTGHKRVVVLFILLGMLMRAFLLARPISFTEAQAYVDFATLPFGDLIADYSFPINHIFHTVLSRISTSVFGVGVVQLRLPSFVAGVLALPLFYLFVRAMFNRYIALITLAITAASGPLIQMSAQAHGYSIVCCCFVSALLLGRYFVKSDNLFSALLISVVCALGVWSTPSAIYAALAVYIWLLIALTMAYEHSLRNRIFRLLLSFVVFIALAFLLYLPVLQQHGFDQLTNHHTLPRLDWKTFDRRHTDMALNLWAYTADATTAWLGLLGAVGVVYAAFISSKYRSLVFALFAGALVLVLIQRRIEPAPVWGYSLFLFHLSTGIAVFYLLKFIQEKVLPNWGKRSRTILASFLLFMVFAIPGMRFGWQRSVGLPEADRVAQLAEDRLKQGDKFFVQYPWDAPLAFALLHRNVDLAVLNGYVAEGNTVLVAVAPDHEQTVEGVLRHNGQDPTRWNSTHVVQEWPKLKIFAAP